jgi:hypothetical protein
MIVLRRIFYLEHNRNFAVKELDIKSGEIGFVSKPAGRCRPTVALRPEKVSLARLRRSCMTEFGPTFVVFCRSDGQPRRRPARHAIYRVCAWRWCSSQIVASLQSESLSQQNKTSQRVHSEASSNFTNRNLVI